MESIQRFIDLLGKALAEFNRDRAGYLAVAMVYYALVSLVPLLLLLLAGLGILLRFSPAAAQAERQLLVSVQTNFGPRLPEMLRALLNTLEQQSIAAMLAGLVGLLLTASVLFKHLRAAFRAIWRYEPPPKSKKGAARTTFVKQLRKVVAQEVRTKIREQIVSFLMVLGGGGMLLVGMALIAGSQLLSPLLENLPLPSQAITWWLATLSSLIFTAATFAVLFKFLPPLPVRWRDVLLAALLSAIGWVVASEMLALYGSYFGKNRSAPGVIGGVLAIMLWMSLVSKALFFGAELSKVVATQVFVAEHLPAPLPVRPRSNGRSS